MFWKSLTAAFVAILLFSTAAAKGNFQAEGLVSEVRRNGGGVAFRFIGSLSLAYATTPLDHPKNRWSNITLDVIDVVVHIDRWTERHNPSKTAQSPDTEGVFQKLSALATLGRKVRLSIDNPSLSFSNLGSLTGLDGTYVYAVESES